MEHRLDGQQQSLLDAAVTLAERQWLEAMALIEKSTNAPVSGEAIAMLAQVIALNYEAEARRRHA